MKTIIIAVISFAFLGIQTVMAVEFPATLETNLQASKAQAFQTAMQWSKQIASGKNASARGEATLACPGDNNPSFKVRRIKLVTYWLPSAGSRSEEKYTAIIEYVAICKLKIGSGYATPSGL